MNGAQFLEWLKMSKKPSLVMGILNVTPDSFSDGGQFVSPKSACKRAQEMLEQGADIIDVGGESSRPGAVPISVEEELSRVIPVIERIRLHSDVCISIDTHKPMVMREAIKAGASWVNDITALTTEGAMETVAQLQVPICLMHMQQKPMTMQNLPQYRHVVDEINEFFKQRIEACLAANISRQALILDPGFGFGKSVEHNLDIMRGLSVLSQHGLPVLLGASRKHTIGVLLNQDVDERIFGGLAFAAYGMIQGVSIIRTHDVKATKHVLTILDILCGSITS